jgi:OTU domain-containing protein 6
MEDLLTRHRKELRDLQSRITQKKKEATKKTRKAINAECEQLETQTRARHAKEVHELDNPSAAAADEDTNVYVPPPPLSAEEEEPAEPSTTESETASDPVPPIEQLTISASTESPPPGRAQKPNRQKARLARRAAEVAAASEAAALEASSLPNLRQRELSTMAGLLKSHKLTEHQIAPDGHCLYSAFAHSLRTAGLENETVPKDYKEARARCAAFMRENRDDFEGFLEEGFEDHVTKVENTAEWGGQTEVLALGRAFNVKVNVLQAEGRVEKMNEDAEGGEVWLGYYRHAFGLGEHYNSLVKKE